MLSAISGLTQDFNLTCLAPVLNDIDPDAPEDLNQAFMFGPWKRPVAREGTGKVKFPYSGKSAGLFNQGMAYWHAFAYQEAERCFRACMTDDPSHPMPYVGLALANERRPKRAAFFAKEAEKRAGKLEGLEREWLEFHTSGDVEAMSRKLDAMAAAHPDNVEIQAVLLRRAVVNRRPPVEIEKLDALAKRIAELAPEHPGRHYRSLLWLGQDSEKAASFAPAAPQIAPSIPQMWHYAAEAFRVSGNMKEALEYRAKGLEMRLSTLEAMPDETEEFVNHIEAYVGDLVIAGRLDEARAAARELISLPRTFYREKRHTVSQRQAGSFATGRRLLGQLLEGDALLEDCESGMLAPVEGDESTVIESLFWKEKALRNEKTSALLREKEKSAPELIRALREQRGLPETGGNPVAGNLKNMANWSPASAPDFSLPDESGDMRTLKDFAGRPVILNFFLGAGCGFCRQQMDKFTPVLPQFEKSGIQVAGITTDDLQTLQTVIKSYREAGGGTEPLYAFPVLSDSRAAVFKAFGVFDEFAERPLHGTILLDASGRVLWRNIGHEPFNHPLPLLREAKRLLRLH